MRNDLLGQSILLLTAILLFLFAFGHQLSRLTLIVLSLWQILSALHLLKSYRYVRKLNYLRTCLVIGISLPIWFWLVGNWALLPVGGLVLWYFYQTMRDTIIIYRRPKSFWDLS